MRYMLDVLALIISGVALVCAVASVRYARSVSQINRERFERESENVQILPAVEVQGQALILRNDSDDAACDVSLVIKNKHARRQKKVADKLLKGHPVKIPLKSFFNVTITEGQPPRTATEGMRDIDVDIFYRSAKGNLFHKSTQVSMYMGGFDYAARDPGDDLSSAWRGNRWEFE